MVEQVTKDGNDHHTRHHKAFTLNFIRPCKNSVARLMMYVEYKKEAYTMAQLKPLSGHKAKHKSFIQPS